MTPRFLRGFQRFLLSVSSLLFFTVFSSWLPTLFSYSCPPGVPFLKFFPLPYLPVSFPLRFKERAVPFLSIFFSSPCRLSRENRVKKSHPGRTFSILLSSATPIPLFFHIRRRWEFFENVRFQARPSMSGDPGGDFPLSEASLSLPCTPKVARSSPVVQRGVLVATSSISFNRPASRILLHILCFFFFFLFFLLQCFLSSPFRFPLSRAGRARFLHERRRLIWSVSHSLSPP